MKNFIVTVSADTIADFREKLRELAKEFGVGVSDPQLALPLPEAEESPARKRGRPRKVVEEAPVPVTKEVTGFAPAPAAVEEEKPVEPATKEQAVAALSALSSAKGLPVARDVLAKFEVLRLSELDPSKYGDFVAAAKAEIEK